MVASKEGPPEHWVGSPPTRFRNPWSSFRQKHSLASIVSIRFGSGRNFVPVPEDRKGLVPIQPPDWGAGKHGTKVTWIGHASFLIETAPASPASVPKPAETAVEETTSGSGSEVPMTQSVAQGGGNGKAYTQRGIRILLDPVFCDRMGPRNWVGPKRFSPPPCRLEDVPLADAVCISHNHYDHLDVDTLQRLYVDKRRTTPLHFFCGLGSKAWFVGCGIRPEDVTEMDWWDEVVLAVPDTPGSSVRIACTPSQHASRRGPFDDNQMLWCSFAIREGPLPPAGGEGASALREEAAGESSGRSIFFAGDTGYRAVTEDDVAAGRDVEELPRCPAFAEIGQKYGPFDLALLPIGCYSPRTFLSGVHCSPEDAIEIHVDVRSKKSLGMHYGTVRGGLSAQYEDVLEPPLRWKEACDKRGLMWNKEICVCNIGETIVLE